LTPQHTTILLVGHGSRDARGNEEIARFADDWRARHPDWRIEVCFIEFADCLLDAGLDIAATDSQLVVVAPLILGAAGHVKMEIPHHIAQARRRHPDVTFRLARHLGATEELLQALRHELTRAMRQLDMPDPDTTGVVLLARGSSDMTANGEVAKLARWMEERTDHPWVEAAFTGITRPRLETAVQRQVRCGMTQMVILPCYLFTGVLIERIGRQLARLKRQYPTVAFASGNYIGFSDAVFTLLDQRVADALGNNDDAPRMLECDGCKYRALAATHDAGHHHHHGASQ